MKICHKSSALALLLITTLSGCSVVNTFAPEKPVSDIVYTAGKLAHDEQVVNFCPASEFYMVMPEADGKQGIVDVIFNDGREAVLHGEYSTISDVGEAYVSDESEMRELFSDSLSALPAEPYTANLYYITGTDSLTPASEIDANEIYQNVSSRQAPEVLISGHTDTVGSDASNIKLSEQRAEMVRINLIDRGVDPDTISTFAHGESELLIETADDVDEQENRRVEIEVR
jgi:outer membrane protein OmpA-like peptidoglycan-associated protein